MRRLPPLTAIEAFVQVARLGSVKAAAEQLALSSPALSRRVQTLERFVGRPLFERRHQAMLLNAEGAALLDRIAPAIAALGEAIDATRGDSAQLRLKLGVLPLFASQQLMGRLPDLRRRQPELHIDIDTAPHALARLGDELDAAIVVASEIDPALYSRRLDRNRVVPLGVRDLKVAGQPLRRPEQLAQATILLHRDLPETFDIWRTGIGMPDLQPATIDHFDSGQLILEAAAEGLGVAFMLDSHLEAAQDPRLVSLFDREVESDYSYWFVCRRTAIARRPVRLFHDWLVAGLKEEGLRAA